MLNVLKNRSKWIAIACMTACCGALASWPDDQPIELIVGFAPGGGTDLMARTMARFLEKRLGEKARIVVVNKPGSGGELAAAYVAKAKADGYTIGMVNVPGFVFLPMYKKTMYQPDDLRLIARLVEDPIVFVTRRTEDARPKLQDVVRALQKVPSSVSFGHGGEGTTGHVALMQLEESAGVRANSIPFKGAADARTALLGGHIDYALITSGEVPNLGDEKSLLRAVAIASEKRLASIPDMPTVSESGFNVRISSERGLAGPKTLPTDIVQRFERAIDASMRDPEFLAAAKNDAPVLAFLPGEAWTRSLLQTRQSLKPFVHRMAQ